MIIRKGDSTRVILYMSDATDNESPETGITPTVTLSKNGGAFAAATNAAVEISNGFYYVTLSVTETNAAGPLIVRATGTGANTWIDIHEVRESIITDSEAERICDIILRRHLDDVEASSNGNTPDKASLLGMALLTLNSSIAGSTLTVKKTDTTTLGTLTITVDGSGNWTGKSL